MKAVMAKLNFNIAKFLLTRRVTIKQTRATADPSKWRVRVFGIEPDGTPATVIRQLDVDVGKGKKLSLETEPMRIKSEQISTKHLGDPPKLALTLHWFGHYEEPALDIVRAHSVIYCVCLLGFLSGSW
jgi:hypothetical protein